MSKQPLTNTFFLRIDDLKPLQNTFLFVAAVCDHRGFMENGQPTALIERRYRCFAEVSIYTGTESLREQLSGGKFIFITPPPVRTKAAPWKRRKIKSWNLES